jgi:Caudovirus prohead serine protease
MMRFRKVPRVAKGKRLADVSWSSYDADAHTVEVVLSTGAAVRREFGIEVLQIKPGAVNLKRLGTCGIPVIDSHNVAGIGGVLGNLRRAWFDGGKLLGLIAFDDSKAGRNAEGLVARGMVRAVSIGYRVDKWEVVDPDGDVIDPEKERMRLDVEYILTAVRWTLFEVSLVSVPADQDAVFRVPSRADGLNPQLLALSRAVTVRSGDLSVTYEFGEHSGGSSNEATLARMRARHAMVMRSSR